MHADISHQAHSRRERQRVSVGEARSVADSDSKLEVMARFSHELRNSLGSIRNAVHVLKSGPANSAEHEAAQRLAERQISRMAALIDDVLDASRMRNGKFQLRPGRFDLCVIVCQAMHAVECTMRERGHRMAASLPDEPVWIECDAARLEQVFVNLLMNAAKYTDIGGDVSISVERKAGEAVIHVRDSGVGIAADVLPKVFDLYVQANPSSRGGGLGLGLPLVRSLVERHGGSVSVASEGAGKGSEFTVRLPAFACLHPAKAMLPKNDPAGVARAV